jgi:hypothetical protein
VVVTGQLLIGACGDDRGAEVLGAQWRAGACADRRRGGGPESTARRRPTMWHGRVMVLRERGKEEAGGVAQRGTMLVRRSGDVAMPSSQGRQAWSGRENKFGSQV